MVQALISDETVDAMRIRLDCMRPRVGGGSSDGLGKYLGDGLPHKAGCDLRTVQLSQALEELLAWRKHFAGSLEFDAQTGAIGKAGAQQG